MFHLFNNLSLSKFYIFLIFGCKIDVINSWRYCWNADFSSWLPAWTWQQEVTWQVMFIFFPKNLFQSLCICTLVVRIQSVLYFIKNNCMKVQKFVDTWCELFMNNFTLRTFRQTAEFSASSKFVYPHFISLH
jgi:hypothetical protein